MVFLLLILQVSSGHNNESSPRAKRTNSRRKRAGAIQQWHPNSGAVDIVESPVLPYALPLAVNAVKGLLLQLLVVGKKPMHLRFRVRERGIESDEGVAVTGAEGDSDVKRVWRHDAVRRVLLRLTLVPVELSDTPIGSRGVGTSTGVFRFS
jgi:hypothetical protein